MSEKNFKVRKGVNIGETVGINTDSASVSLDIRANDAIFVPSGNTGQRPTGANGLFRYNTETNQFEGYANGAWGAIAGSGAAQGNTISSSGTIANGGVVVWNDTDGLLVKSSSITINGNNKITFIASNSSGAYFNIPQGTAPSSPVNGDAWTTNQNLFIRINGTTVSFVNKAGDTLTGRLVSSSGVGTGNASIANSASSLGEIEIQNNGTGAACISFLRTNSYAVYFGLDIDNKLKVGGWSMTNNAYQIWHEGNQGTGSTMDADTVDGYHANVFLTANTYTANDVLTKIKTVDGSASGLDADTVDGYHANSFLTTDTYTASDVLTKIKTVDGASSGLDADLLDGQEGSYYQRASTAITTSNIGSQSVNYATSSGSSSTCTTATTISGYYHYQLAKLSGATFTGNVQVPLLLSTGDIIAYYSDKRLKENIEKIPNALSKIEALNGILYNNNDLAKSFGFNNNERHVGVLAQDVYDVLPEATALAPFDAEQDKNGKWKSISGENYLTVKYEKIVPLLIEGIKEQQQQINKQQAQIDRLENTVAMLLDKLSER